MSFYEWKFYSVNVSLFLLHSSSGVVLCEQRSSQTNHWWWLQSRSFHFLSIFIHSTQCSFLFSLSGWFGLQFVYANFSPLNQKKYPKINQYFFRYNFKFDYHWASISSHYHPNLYHLSTSTFPYLPLLYLKIGYLNFENLMNPLVKM